jgi:hypothetical protein
LLEDTAKDGGWRSGMAGFLHSVRISVPLQGYVSFRVSAGVIRMNRLATTIVAAR